MIYPSKPAVTQTAINAWLNKAWNTMKATRATGGRGVRVAQSNDGFSLGLSSEQIPFMSYAGDFEPNAGYSINEVVRVTTSASYVETTGGQSTTKWSHPGIYICVRDVPMNVSAAQFSTAPTYVYRYVQALARDTGVVYAPIYPEPTTDPYWVLLSLLPIEMGMCVDGIEKTYYVSAFETGSLG